MSTEDLSATEVEIALQNYRRLLEKVDAHCLEISRLYPTHIHCIQGCDACCRQFSVFPVEALSVAAVMHGLPDARSEAIRERARRLKDSDTCPLLSAHACTLYTARPIICRTHGFPILTHEAGKAQVDFCPENFEGLTSLDRNALIDIDRLNKMLSAINLLFVSALNAHHRLPDRFTLSEALLFRLSRNRKRPPSA